MTVPKLPVLASIAVALLAVRWLTWPTDMPPPAVVAATSRPDILTPARANVLTPTRQWPELGTARAPDDVEPRNAFAVRQLAQAKFPMPAKPIAAPIVPPPDGAVAETPPPVAQAVVAPAPAPSPPPLPPPLQIIGAWKDAAGSSLFMSTPLGVTQVRAGETVFQDWQVEAIGTQAVLLKQQSTQRNVQLPLPESTRAAFAALEASK